MCSSLRLSSTIEARRGSRWASTSAMVCGCSVSSSLPSCCGSVRCSLARLPCAASCERRTSISRSSARSLPKVSHQQPAGVVQAPVDHEVLGLQQLPELLQYLGGHLRRDAAQIGQLLGQPLHVHLRQGAQNLLGQLLAHGHQQNRRLAHSGHVRRLAAPRCSVLASLLGQGSVLSLRRSLCYSRL